MRAEKERELDLSALQINAPYSTRRIAVNGGTWRDYCNYSVNDALEKLLAHWGRKKKPRKNEREDETGLFRFLPI